MNVQNLKDNYPKLIDYMREEGYSKNYTDNIVKEIERIIRLAPTKKWNSYENVYYDYVKDNRLGKYLIQKRSLLNTIKYFETYGKYPNGGINPKFITTTAYSNLCDNYKSIIDCYCAMEQERGRKKSTVYNEASCGANFLLYLLQKGCDSLDKVTEKLVLSFFISNDGKVCKSYEYKKSIVAVFKACISIYPESKTIIAFLPKLKRYRKNIQYLTIEEVEKFKIALKDKNNKLALRTRAIGYLIAYTGLRSCDVANLTLDSIDWDMDSISIKQQKNDTPLQLPLTAIIGNAIYDYITLERKSVDTEYLFVSYKKPYKAIKAIDIRKSINQTMDVAGIRQEAGDRKGSHIFRHYVSTKLIGSNVARPVVSAILGHGNPNSLDTYLHADFIHLKQCALTIENFPIPEGVFNDA